MTLLNRIKNITELWELLLPHVPAPDATQINHWCQYPDEVIERGIHRAASKYRAAVNPYPDQELVIRYAGGVMANESRAHATNQKETIA